MDTADGFRRSLLGIRALSEVGNGLNGRFDSLMALDSRPPTIPAKVPSAASIRGLQGDPRLSRMQFVKSPMAENKGPVTRLIPAAWACWKACITSVVPGRSSHNTKPPVGLLSLRPSENLRHGQRRQRRAFLSSITRCWYFPASR